MLFHGLAVPPEITAGGGKRELSHYREESSLTLSLVVSRPMSLPGCGNLNVFPIEIQQRGVYPGIKSIKHYG